MDVHTGSLYIDNLAERQSGAAGRLEQAGAAWSKGASTFVGIGEVVATFGFMGREGYGGLTNRKELGPPSNVHSTGKGASGRWPSQNVGPKGALGGISASREKPNCKTVSGHGRLKRVALGCRMHVFHYTSKTMGLLGVRGTGTGIGLTLLRPH